MPARPNRRRSPRHDPVPRALIDLGAIRYNLGVVRRHAPKSRVWAVIKADAYGHGMEPVAETLGVPKALPWPG
jgi:alanine racemase